MFLNSWSIALTLVSLLSCFLVIMAGKTAVRVLRWWNPDSDSNTQIQLEGEIWLSSTLVMYGACFQIISLVLLIGATDYYAGFIAGAMCATGSLLANGYGMPLLYVKLAASFYAGLWIVVHRLDISSEAYPLVRFKYVMLLLLVPLIIADLCLQTLYIGGLTPDIITSCCAIIFDEVKTPGSFSGLFQSPLLFFYLASSSLLLLGLICRKKGHPWLVYLYGVAMVGWLVFALDAIITTFSSFIYAMPYHHCPFCIVKAEYNFIGYFIYIALFGSVFFGFCGGFVQLFGRNRYLERGVRSAQQVYLTWSSLMLFLFVALVSYHMVIYRIFGGEG